LRPGAGVAASPGPTLPRLALFSSGCRVLLGTLFSPPAARAALESPQHLSGLGCFFGEWTNRPPMADVPNPRGIWDDADMHCVCGSTDGPLCERCSSISRAEVRAGVRPWAWIAHEHRRRSVESLTPDQVRGIHDRAMRRLRRAFAEDTDAVHQLLQDLEDERRPPPRHRAE